MEYEQLRIILTTIVPLIAVSIFMRYLLSTSTKSVPRSFDGILILKPSKGVGYLGMFLILIILFVSYMILKEGGAISRLLVIDLVFLLLGVYLMAFGFVHKIEVSEDAIISSNLFVKPSIIYFKEIQKVTFSQYSKYLTLYTGKSKMRVLVTLIGFNDFVDLFKKKVNQEILKESLTKLDKFYSNMGLHNTK